MASALSLVAGILGDERSRAEAELYLAEGIDCTEHGEYTERSAGIYNVVNNRSLMIVAEELDRPELLDHVARNLEMVMKYVEPDGSVFTLNSRRQDFGRRLYPVNYYENYLLMAHKTGNPVYAGMADRLLAMAEENRENADGLGPVLSHYQLHAELREEDIDTQPPPTSYRLENPGSGIVRLRRDDVSCSLLAGKTGFLTFQKGENRLVARMATTFYGQRGRFTAKDIVKDGDDYLLRHTERWGYVRPFPSPPSTSNWDEMPHDQREHVHMQDLLWTVRAGFTGDELRLDISVEGQEGVLWKLELFMPPDGWLETGDLRLPGRAGCCVFLKGEAADYTVGWDRIGIRGGFSEHSYGPNMRGSESPDPESFAVYLTGYTPIRCQVRLVGES
jgi:hypothetical protein